MSEHLTDQNEALTRSPEVQQMLDTAIDRLLAESVKSAGAFDKNDPDQRVISNTIIARYGLRHAAVILATEIDGSQGAIDKVTSFYADLSLNRGSFFHSIDELQTAYWLTMNHRVSPAVAEKVLLAKIYACHLADADKLANQVLERNLRDDELLAMVDVYTHGASRSQDDRRHYLEVAASNGASQAILERIDRAFDDMDDRWAHDLM
jgi:hypothetical protein